MEQRLDMRGAGTLVLRQEGPRIHLEASRPEDGRGLYKVWLTGQKGGRLLLGTMAPEGAGLRLKRTLSLGELERAGCWPLTGAETILAFPFSSAERWYCEQHPEQLTDDPVLRRQLKSPMLCRRGRDGFWLAAPFRTDSPVALEALFCLARMESLEGRPHLVWSFDEKGRPKIPHKKEHTGKD